jgi:hypothetical protein
MPAFNEASNARFLTKGEAKGLTVPLETDSSNQPTNLSESDFGYVLTFNFSKVSAKDKQMKTAFSTPAVAKLIKDGKCPAQFKIIVRESLVEKVVGNTTYPVGTPSFMFDKK